MNIISFDLGKFNSMACFSNPQKKEQRTQLAKSDRSYLRTLLKNNPCDLVVMEACSTSGWVHDLCQELEIPTLVCSTHEDAWRWRNVKRKTDKDDAIKLARLAWCGELLLRTLLLECAWCSLRYNQWSRATYERIHGGKQVRRKKAAIALARKILVIAWAMLRDESDYDKHRNLPKPEIAT